MSLNLSKYLNQLVCCYRRIHDGEEKVTRDRETGGVVEEMVGLQIVESVIVTVA